ncbi:hypothetical protein FQA39_LY10403 [Lamprigera yunnana]|nr:hypothetical protein FQA39_LY10403 [Lamprigera yunnana]
MQFNRFLLVLLLGICVVVSTSTWEDKFHLGFSSLVKYGIVTPELESSLNGIQFPYLFQRSNTRKEKFLREDSLCSICNTTVDIIIQAARNGIPIEFLANAAIRICTVLNILSSEICKGVVESYVDTFEYIIKRSRVTSERVCSIVLQEYDCIDNSTEDWTINIPSPPSQTDSVDNYKEETFEAKPFKVLQLTDLHYDPNYRPNSNANCGEPVCCQKGSTPATPEDAAGYWGDYRHCDLPWHAFVDALNHIVTEHQDIDYIYFTGDIIDHKVWSTNVAENSEVITKVYNYLKKTFGTIPIYPILGNHEPHPVNLFSLTSENNHEINTKWIFNLSAEHWLHWLPSDDTKNTILQGGYYTTLVRDKLRIIALNSNVCFTLNFWLFYDDVDPFGQLQWLADTLAEAEKNKEFVHIISHVPTGDGQCLHNWSDQYVKIIQRFAHIITAQFNGHTHNDDTIVFFDIESKPINVAFNGGSLTPFSNLNPNYKMYQIDSTTFKVIDYDVWAYNLTEANWDPQTPPQWHKLYSFKNSYDINDTLITPNGVARLVESMALNPSTVLIQKYFEHKYRKADTVIAMGCDSECEIENLCYMVTYLDGNNIQCEAITKKYDSVRPPKKYS